MSTEIIKFEQIKPTINTWKKTILSNAILEYDKNVFMRDVQIAFNFGENADKLRDCFKKDFGALTVYYSLSVAARTGLSVNPQLNYAALVPYWDNDHKCYTCSYQIMKDGLIKLARDTGQIIDFRTITIRENDELEIFQSSDGDEWKLKQARHERGELDSFLAYCEKNNGKKYVYRMTISEVNDWAHRYASKKDGNLRYTWQQSFEGMALKTVAKRLISSLNLSADMRDVVRLDEQIETGQIIDVISNENIKGITSEQAIKQLESKQQKQETPKQQNKSEKDSKKKLF
jgi:phage RecT family recombinase